MAWSIGELGESKDRSAEEEKSQKNSFWDPSAQQPLALMRLAHSTNRNLSPNSWSCLSNWVCEYVASKKKTLQI